VDRNPSSEASTGQPVEHPSDTELHGRRLFAASRSGSMHLIASACKGRIIKEHRMFGKKDTTSIKTLIARGTQVNGDLKFEEGLRVDGEVHGAIQGNSEGGTLLVISEGAVADGGLKADHVIINGTVKGPVEARELLELQSNARIEGDVHYLALQMHQGATILGQLRPLGTGAAGSSDDKTVFRLLASKSA
jgi:cytoskeletal protein CcmA (bactofilin family)